MRQSKELFLLSLSLPFLVLACKNDVKPKTDKTGPLHVAPADGQSDKSPPDTITDDQESDDDDEPYNGVDVVLTEPCDSTYQEYCDEDNVAHFCGAKGLLTVRDCNKLASGLTCQKLLEDNFVDCVMPCDYNEFEEYHTCEGKYISTHFCMKVQGSDSYYEFSFTDNPCEYGCRDGKCLKSPPPKEGASCKPGEFVPDCYGNSYYTCEGAVVTRHTCGGGTECSKLYGDFMPQCVTDCNKNDTYGCAASGKALDNYVCRLGNDNKYHYFHETTECKNFCKNGICDVDSLPSGTCDYQTSDDLCAQNTLYYCSTETNDWVSIECGKGEEGMGMPLCRQLNKGYSDCVSPCTPDDTEAGYSECSTGGSGDNKFKFIYGIECRKAMDGAYYFFNFEEKCPGDCKNGACL